MQLVDPGLLTMPDMFWPGRWTVCADRSRLRLDVAVCGMLGVRGRFTDLSGHLDVAPDPAESLLDVAVVASSLTTDNPTRDRLLTATGLIDPAAGPHVRYTARTFRAPDGSRPWRVEGWLSTLRGARPLMLTLAGAAVGPDSIRLRTRGSLPRADLADLLARPGCSGLVGRHARLDLTLDLAPAGPGS